MSKAVIDAKRGCWCDHDGVTYILKDILQVLDPYHFFNLTKNEWVVPVMLKCWANCVYGKVEVILQDEHAAWDFCYALRQARTNLAVERTTGNLWGPVPKE